MNRVAESWPDSSKPGRRVLAGQDQHANPEFGRRVYYYKRRTVAFVKPTNQSQNKDARHSNLTGKWPKHCGQTSPANRTKTLRLVPYIEKNAVSCQLCNVLEL